MIEKYALNQNKTFQFNIELNLIQNSGPAPAPEVERKIVGMDQVL